MKALVSGILLLGLTSLGFAQENPNGIQTVELEAITLSANADYIKTVNDERTPEVVKALHLKAASFDPTSAKDFDPKEKNPYEAVFKASNGSLIAAYGPSGAILASQAKFSNVTLPVEVREKAFADKDGWKMKGNQYMSTYVDNKLVKQRYKIQFENGRRSEKMILDLL
ncbi:MAG: hypothetical protein ABF293_07900 [Flavobacteriaceae bacterium]